MVGHARPASGGSSAFFGFIKYLNESAYDAGVSPWYSETDSINPVKSITAINNWGDVIGTRSDGTSFFQSDFYGDVSPPSTWTNAVFTALNDWGEVVGVEMSDPNYDMGLWSHFLLSEGWFSHLSFPGFVMPEHDLPEPDSEEWTFDNTYYSPSMINDWSDFSGRISIWNTDDSDNYIADTDWFHGGITYNSEPPYREILPRPFKNQTIHAFNNWPQILVTGTRPVPWEPDPGEPQEFYPPETFLCAEDVRIH